MTYLNYNKDCYFLVCETDFLTFTDANAVKAFMEAMQGGPDALISAMANNGIFVELPVGQEVFAEAAFNNFLATQDTFVYLQEADTFLAEEYEVEFLADVLGDLAEWLLALAATSDTKPEETELERKARIAKTAKYFNKILQDPAKKAAWFAKGAAIRARTTKPGDESPAWSISTQNLSMTESLTFVGDLPYVMPATYTILEQPERSLPFGVETLAWSPSDAGSFLYGEDGYCVTWKTENGHSFAVNIWIPLHVLRVGDDAYYQVWYDAWGPRPDNWLTPPGGPTASYTFPGGWGYTVKVVPTLNEGKLSVAVTVEQEAPQQLEA